MTSRKQRNTYIALALLVLYAVGLLVAGDPPPFLTFASAIVGVLGVGNFSIAYEDARKARNAFSQDD